MKGQGYARGNIIGAFAEGPTRPLHGQETSANAPPQGYIAEILGSRDGERENTYGYISRGPGGIEIEWTKAPEINDGKAINLRIMMTGGFGEDLDLKDLF